MEHVIIVSQKKIYFESTKSIIENLTFFQKHFVFSLTFQNIRVFKINHLHFCKHPSHNIEKYLAFSLISTASGSGSFHNFKRFEKVAFAYL